MEEKKTYSGIIEGVKYTITQELFDELKEKFPDPSQIALIEEEIKKRGTKDY